MYPYYYRLLSGKPCPSLSSLRVHGSLEASSMVEKPNPDTDTDTPELVGAWVQGRYYMGEPDGGEREFLSAEATVPIEHAR